MTLQQEVFEAYRKHINAHREENRKGGLEVKHYVEHSALNYHGVLDKTVHIPKVFGEETIERFRKIADLTYGIFTKVIREYREHADYRALFPFPKEMEELILLPVQYDLSLIHI